ncbi:OmpH family outer membrane protein [Parabacteroides sp. PF5-9]|uniref:OmpH family outer membrane protein n=1 Tax=Parabacteroides sp. PF5-9 TaxID=1742404 RepID=UPI0032AEC6A1
MKKLIILLVAMLPLGLFAQDIKLAYVNVSELYNAMPEMDEVEKKLTDFNEEYRKELERMQEEYNKKYSDFIAQQDSLTENIRLRRMQEVQDIETRIQNLYQQAQQEVPKKQQELLQPIQQKVMNAIKQVGEEKGYTYIFDPQVFLYVNPSSAIDATSFVKTKLGI